MTYDKEQSHKEIREAIAAWVLDKTLPKPKIERQIGGQFICDDNPSISEFLDYCDTASFRLKPTPLTLIRVNGILCQAPEQVAPEAGEVYYKPILRANSLYEKYTWVGDAYDTEWLNNGLVYLTTENAIARSKAMLVYEVVV